MLRYFVTLKDFMECSALFEALKLVFECAVEREASFVVVRNPLFMQQATSILAGLLPGDFCTTSLEYEKKRISRLFVNGLILTGFVFLKRPF